jgi:hypothetical protein
MKLFPPSLETASPKTRKTSTSDSSSQPSAKHQTTPNIRLRHLHRSYLLPDNDHPQQTLHPQRTSHRSNSPLPRPLLHPLSSSPPPPRPPVRLLPPPHEIFEFADSKTEPASNEIDTITPTITCPNHPTLSPRPSS